MPFLPWAVWPFSVVIVLVVVVAVAKWLPEQLEGVYDGWRGLAQRLKDEHSGSAVAAAPMLDRRAGGNRRRESDRRCDHDRRHRQISITLERRSGIDRRRGERRGNGVVLTSAA
jgi:hypothetical protein